jgi:hypothetical protein
VAEDQAHLTIRRGAVLARDDLAVGAADAERERIDEQCALCRRGLSNLL